MLRINHPDVGSMATAATLLRRRDVSSRWTGGARGRLAQPLAALRGNADAGCGGDGAHSAANALVRGWNRSPGATIFDKKRGQSSNVVWH